MSGARSTLRVAVVPPLFNCLQRTTKTPLPTIANDDNNRCLVLAAHMSPMPPHAAAAKRPKTAAISGAVAAPSWAVGAPAEMEQEVWFADNVRYASLKSECMSSTC